MKDMLIGFTTLIVLFGIVSLSQKTADDVEIQSNTDITRTTDSDYSNITNNVIEIENIDDTKNINPCDLCNDHSEINANLQFSEAFKVCRECLGDEGLFSWRGQLFTTKIKNEKSEVNLVEKEDTESAPPLNNKDETVDSH